MGRSAVITIKDAAASIGVHPTTLRRWERAGVIPPATRRRGFRVYTSDDVAMIRHAIFGVAYSGGDALDD